MGAKNSAPVVTRRGRSSTPRSLPVVVRTRAVSPSSPSSSPSSAPAFSSSSSLPSASASSSSPYSASSPPPSAVAAPTCHRLVLGAVPFSTSDGARERRWPLSVVAHCASFLDVPAHCRFACVCRHFFHAASTPAASPYRLDPFSSSGPRAIALATEVVRGRDATGSCGCFGGVFRGASAHWRPTHVRYDRPRRPLSTSVVASAASSRAAAAPAVAATRARVSVARHNSAICLTSVEDVARETHREFWRWAYANPSLRRLECRVEDAWTDDESLWSPALPPQLQTFSLEGASGALARRIASETLTGLVLHNVAFHVDLELVNLLGRCPTLVALRLVSVTFEMLALSAIADRHVPSATPDVPPASKATLSEVLRRYDGDARSLPAIASLSTQNLQPRIASLLVCELRRTLKRVRIVDTGDMQSKSDWGWRPDEYADSVGQCAALTRLEFAAIRRPAWHSAFFAVPPSPGLLTYFLPSLAWLSLLRVGEWPPTVVAVDLGCSGPHGHLVAPAPPQSPTPPQYTKPNAHIRAVAFCEFEESPIGDDAATSSATVTAATFLQHRQLLFGRFPRLAKLTLPLNHTALAFALSMARGDDDDDGRARLSRVEFRLDSKRRAPVLGLPAPEFARRAFLLLPKVAVVFTAPSVAASAF